MTHILRILGKLAFAVIPCNSCSIVPPCHIFWIHCWLPSVLLTTLLTSRLLIFLNRAMLLLLISSSNMLITILAGMSVRLLSLVLVWRTISLIENLVSSGWKLVIVENSLIYWDDCSTSSWLWRVSGDLLACDKLMFSTSLASLSFLPLVSAFFSADDYCFSGWISTSQNVSAWVASAAFCCDFCFFLPVAYTNGGCSLA